MHIILIWKTDKVFALVFGPYVYRVYILNMRIWLPLVIPNNEMTFSSFQNTLFSFIRKLLVNSVAILSYLREREKKKPNTQDRDYDVSIAISVQFPLRNILITVHCYAEESRAITVSGTLPQLSADFLTLCNNQHNSLLTERQPHLMLISRLVNGNNLKDFQLLRRPRD